MYQYQVYRAIRVSWGRPSIPLGLILIQTLSNKLSEGLGRLDFRRSGITIETNVYVYICNVLLDGIGIHGGEGGSAAEQFQGCDSQRPNIRLFRGKKNRSKTRKKYFVIIRIIQNHLRSHPARSANEGLGLTLSSRKLADSTSDSKVGQTNVAITINQNVTSFDITTHNDFVWENTDEWSQSCAALANPKPLAW